jgi:lysophospholipid hydrolase
MHVNAGQVLWRPQDESDSFYIVINGRLRAIEETDNDGDVRITAEYGQVIFIPAFGEVTIINEILFVGRHCW